MKGKLYNSKLGSTTRSSDNAIRFELENMGNYSMIMTFYRQLDNSYTIYIESTWRGERVSLSLTPSELFYMIAESSTP